MEDNQRNQSDNQTRNDVTLPKPDDGSKPEGPATINRTPAAKQQSSHWRGVGIILFSFLAGVLGAWLLLISGLVQPETTIQTQEKLMLAEGDVISDVAERVSPSVVSIVIEANQLDLFDRSRTTQAAGTGMIISEDGYILTNKHVIPNNVTNLKVVLSDGTEYDEVRVIGKDPLNDIAFLKLNDARNLKPIQLADSSQVEVGQRVIAVGNALGEFDTTVTSGIISGLSRSLIAGSGLDTEQLSDLIQTDAAINPGNSGGPLVNLKGEVVGVNTAIADSAEGIGFAIPINAAKGLIKTVTNDGKVQRAYIGVQYTMINPGIADELNLPVKQGALIRSSDGAAAVINDSPAQKAGLRENDIITKVEDQDVTRNQSLALLLSQKVPGDKVKITYLRDGKTQEASVTLEELRR